MSIDQYFSLMEITEDDVVYELLRKKKQSIGMVLVDIMCEFVFSIANSFQESQCVFFLVASEKKGLIYCFEGDHQKDCILIPDWSSEDKKKFRSKVVGNYVYRKYRVLRNKCE